MLEFQFQYNTLFQLDITHQYFSKQGEQVFIIKPSSEFTQLMKKTGMMMKIEAETGSIHFMYDTYQMHSLIYCLENFDSVNFSFYLYPTVDYFSHFTNSYTDFQNTLFYLSNVTLDVEKTDTTLHEKDFVEGVDIFKLKSGNFEATPQHKKNTLQLQNKEKEIVMEYTENTSYKVELQSLPEGKYSLVEDGKERESFIYLDEHLFPKPAGMVEITLTKRLREYILKSLYKNNLIPNYRYKICFSTRAIYWKYYIVPKYAKEMTTIEITGEEGIVFEGPEEVSLSDGSKAFVFESTKPIPLHQHSPYKFSLLKENTSEQEASENENSKFDVLISRLPVPNVTSVLTETKNNQLKEYSEIFVFI